MRYLTFFSHGRNRIDIRNSFLGEERIYYNGEQVSRHSSIFGSTHEFDVTEDNELVRYTVNIEIKWPLRIGFDIYRNGTALLLS